MVEDTTSAGSGGARGGEGPSPRPWERYHALLWETMLQGVVFQDARGVVVSMNPAAERILGKSAEELLSQTSVSVERDTLREDGTPFPGREHPAMVALATGHAQRDVVMAVYNPRERRHRWISITAVPLFEAGQLAPYAVYTLFDDITFHREIEQELKEARADFQGILDASDQSILLFGEAETVLAANRAAQERLSPGRPVVGKKVREILPAPLAEARLARFREALRGGGPVRFEDQRAGRRYEHTLYPVRGPAGVNKVAVFARDVTEQRRQEEAQRRAEAEEATRRAQDAAAAELAEAQRIAHLGSWSLDLESGAFQVSDGLCHLLRFDPGHPPANLAEAARGASPELKLAASRGLEAVKAGGPPASCEGQLVLPGGEKRWLVLRVEAAASAGGAVRRVRGTAQDVTEERRLEQELAQGRRLDAIGALAGGVAHDFNNLLGIILGYAETVRRDLPADSPAREELGEVVAAARRGAALTRQLLAFGRRQVLRPVVLDPNQVIRELARMLKRVLGENLELKLQLSEGAGLVLADPAQLEQVVLNLAVNARDAISGHGTLTLATEAVEVDGARAPKGVAPGPYFELTVADTGQGMDEATLARIYEPFFTTKPAGKGTGLGLPTVHGIVFQSKGFLEVASHPGQGTTFRVLLPRVAGGLPAAAPEPPPAPERSTAQGVLLVVEDDAALRQFIARGLSRAGYQVLLASGGPQAVDQARAAPRLDALLTDVVMPRMGGPEVAQAVRALHPGVRVLFVTGFVEEATDSRELLALGQVLAKPFGLDDLVDAVGKVLAGPAVVPGPR